MKIKLFSNLTFILISFIILTIGYYIEYKGNMHLFGLSGFFYFLGRYQEEKESKI